MTELVRIHGLVELDPEPEREIQRWRDDLSEASGDVRGDIEIRLHRYETGREIIVRMTVTIELDDDGEHVRRPGPVVTGVWFTREDLAGNAEHARQLVMQRLRPALDELAQTGVQQRTVGLPIVLDFDDAVEAALGERDATPVDSAHLSEH